jgi:hypothetical protein
MTLTSLFFSSGEKMLYLAILIGAFLVITAVTAIRRAQKRQQRVRELQSKAEQELRQKQLAAAEEAKRRDDARYDRIINCPGCEGTGRCYEQFDRSDGMLYHWFMGPTPYRPPAAHRGTTTCPLCGGSAVAVAFAVTETCPACKGTGTETVSVKAEIGLAATIFPCSTCGGVSTASVINVRFAHETPFDCSFYFSKVVGKPSTFIENRAKFVVTPTNQEFFTKWKPREGESPIDVGERSES